MLWLVWLVSLILGTWGVYQRIAQGHLPAGYGSYVPWGLWVALYFHGVGIAGGAFVIGALGFILDWPGFTKPAVLRAVIVLSAAAILPAFAGVWFDLGHMERSANIFLSPSFTSMMAFNAWMYSVFMVVAAICWLLSYRRQSAWLKPWLCLGMLFSILFPSQSGAFFGVVDARPFWHSALLPILFLTSAVTAGAATLLVVRAIVAEPGDGENSLAAVARLRVLTLIGIVAYFVFEFAEFSIALWNPLSHSPALELILWGPYWWVFWIVHLLLGGLIPLALLATRRPDAWLLAGVLVAVAFISARLNVLVPGQAVGEIQGLQQAFQHERLKYIYNATPMEYLVGLLLLAIGITVFYVGQRLSRALAGSRTE
jgi:molybdopterin-containing oxidoreductase family membrane subunit